MTDEEVNKTIAEYMDLNVEYWDLYKVYMIRISNYKGKARRVPIPEYTKSLDLLTPVWEKLEYLGVQIEWCPDDKYMATLTRHRENCIKGDTIQQASAKVTAKAILNMEEENDG